MAVAATAVDSNSLRVGSLMTFASAVSEGLLFLFIIFRTILSLMLASALLLHAVQAVNTSSFKSKLWTRLIKSLVILPCVGRFLAGSLFDSEYRSRKIDDAEVSISKQMIRWALKRRQNALISHQWMVKYCLPLSKFMSNVHRLFARHALSCNRIPRPPQK